MDSATCANCGKPLSPMWRNKCEHCKTPFSPDLVVARNAARSGGPVTDDAPVVTRTYRGKPEEIEAIRRADADSLAARGYYPKSQNYVPGSWGAGAWVLGVVLILLFGLGLLVLIYLVAVKPPGTLSVIYERVEQRPADKPAAEAVAASAVQGRLETLEQLKLAGAITDEEYAAKRTDILASM